MEIGPRGKLQIYWLIILANRLPLLISAPLCVRICGHRSVGLNLYVH